MHEAGERRNIKLGQRREFLLKNLTFNLRLGSGTGTVDKFVGTEAKWHGSATLLISLCDE
jgi:hypothetical protein